MPSNFMRAGIEGGTFPPATGQKLATWVHKWPFLDRIADTISFQKAGFSHAQAIQNLKFCLIHASWKRDLVLTVDRILSGTNLAGQKWYT
ncbi:MAG: hypothetical protein HY537_17950 [Deltaproteobacteria bacterium]|nr:hypothetical protein [Deltaproteobacteria bacterium]